MSLSAFATPPPLSGGAGESIALVCPSYVLVLVQDKVH